MLCDLVLVAAGSSQRFTLETSGDSDIPKQFQLVFGKPLYLWSLEIFMTWKNIGNIVVVVPENWVNAVQDSFKFPVETKQIHVVSGGSSRKVSASLGVKKLGEISENQYVAIHDSARPCISEALLEKLWKPCIEGSFNDEFSGVVPGVPANETIKSVNSFGVVKETLKRDELRIIQTPQILKREWLEKAYKLFNQEAEAVDDALLLEKMGYKVLVIESTYDNLKVTFSEDMERVSNWFRVRHPQI